ncbi:antitoxin [Streptomyces sp. ISL-96]|uniref:antitoxin n=1 Tax=Streptomyces sp. ISL-96 TaxID=2819191 RepID=UPI001BE882F0|nr:antitoxin [Streptomyces sp. ISL-96]MBT2493571.1 antitoxin [Streptomyces sp. ISL-96]
MGFVDSLKAKLAPAKDKVSDLAQQHEGKIEQGLTKAAKVVDSKTKGKYSSQIESGTGKAKHALDRIAHKDDGTTGGTGGTGTGTGTGMRPSPPPPPPPPPPPG